MKKKPNSVGDIHRPWDTLCCPPTSFIALIPLAYFHCTSSLIVTYGWLSLHRRISPVLWKIKASELEKKHQLIEFHNLPQDKIYRESRAAASCARLCTPKGVGRAVVRQKEFETARQPLYYKYRRRERWRRQRGGWLEMPNAGYIAREAWEERDARAGVVKGVEQSRN